MSGDHWVVAYEVPADRVSIPVLVGMRVEADRPLVVGREGDLALGVDIPDSGVSREALVVTATRHGWRIEVVNRNGAVLHPWGQAASVAQPRTLLSWPLVAVRVRGSVKDAQHWVLLESALHESSGQDENARMGSATTTSVADPPPALTGPELEALSLVFDQQLAWPPVVPASALQLKQVASRLGITDSAVQQRLGNAQRKAERLGLPRRGSLTEPDYLYVLVSAGYVPVTSDRPDRRELPVTHPVSSSTLEQGDTPRP